MTPNILIGIDPGVSTGYAIWNRQKNKFVKLLTIDFWKCLELIELELSTNEGNFEVFIEDPNLNPAMHWNKHKKTSLNVATKIAQNVGANKREASLLIEEIGSMGIPCHPIKPTGNSQTKINKDTFRKYTSWQGESSEHSRDAAMLVFGR